jgi:hypothetical protein
MRPDEAKSDGNTQPILFLRTIIFANRTIIHRSIHIFQTEESESATAATAHMRSQSIVIGAWKRAGHLELLVSAAVRRLLAHGLLVPLALVERAHSNLGGRFDGRLVLPFVSILLPARAGNNING